MSILFCEFLKKIRRCIKTTTVDRIFQLIQENNLTAKDFANKIGVSQGNITDWKKGRSNPSIQALEKIQYKFNVSVDWLLGKSEQKKYVQYKFVEIPENFLNKYCRDLPDYIIDKIKNIAFQLLLDNPRNYFSEFDLDFELKVNEIPEQNIEQVETAVLALYEYNRKYDFLEKVEAQRYYNCPVYGRISAGQPNWAEECLEGYLPIDPNLMSIVDPQDHFFLRVNGESMNKIIRNGAYALIHKQETVENGEIAVVLVNGDEATLKKFSKQGDLIILEPMSDNLNFNTQVYGKDTQIQVLGKYVGKFEMNK